MKEICRVRYAGRLANVLTGDNDPYAGDCRLGGVPLDGKHWNYETELWLDVLGARLPGHGDAESRDRYERRRRTRGCL